MHSVRVRLCGENRKPSKFHQPETVRKQKVSRMNFAAVDLNLLRIFDALMRERSVTRAGNRLGLSQPAVSASLGRLRYLLNDQLFVREGHAMIPTNRALALAEPITAALRQIEDALHAAAPFDPSRETRAFRILGSDYFSTLLMPELAARFGSAAPGALLQLFDGGRANIAPLLANGQVDLALGPLVEAKEWLAAELLFSSGVVAVVSGDHAALAEHDLHPGERFPLDLFCSLPHALCSIDGGLTTTVDEALASVGSRRRVALTLPHFYAVALAVAGGGLIGSLPVHFAKAVADRLGLTIFELPVDPAAVKIAMHWHRRQDEDPGHRWLREQVGGILRAEPASTAATVNPRRSIHETD
jgi:DNA-binding transcriptional LysR family regulator